MVTGTDRTPGSAPLTADHLIKDFLALQRQLRRRPKLSEFAARHHTAKVLNRVFGKPGWKNFILVLGDKALPRNLINAEHLIQHYIEIKKALGKEPLRGQFEYRTHHSNKPIVRIFGRPGWTNFFVVVRARLKKLERKKK